MQASTHRCLFVYPHVRNNCASLSTRKSCQTFATKCTGGKLHCVTGTHRFQPHFCDNSALLRGINWWSVSHLVEEHLYHHFGGFDNFFEGGTVPLRKQCICKAGNKQCQFMIHSKNSPPFQSTFAPLQFFKV